MVDLRVNFAGVKFRNPIFLNNLCIRSLPYPKSVKLALPNSSSNTFSGFKSPYTIPYSCKDDSAHATYAIMNLAYSS
jgi:hypothetical protein